MTTSGTTAFALDLTELIEEAAERAGIDTRGGAEYRSAVRALNLLLLDWGNRGLNLFAIEEGTQAVTAGDNTYTLPADTLDIINAVWRDSNGRDYNIERMGVGTWARVTNKTQEGDRPTRIFIERLVAAPNATLWPVPTSSGSLVYWRLRRLQDAGAPNNTPDVPFRFWPALVAGLAYFMAMKRPEGYQRVPLLKTFYEEAMMRAEAEDRGRESFFIGIWTRGV